MIGKETRRRNNLNSALEQFGQLANEKELFDHLDRWAPERYLIITRDSSGSTWADQCSHIEEAESYFAKNFLAENKEGLAKLPVALADLDEGVITHEVHVSISVAGLPKPTYQDETALTR